MTGFLLKLSLTKLYALWNLLSMVLSLFFSEGPFGHSVILPCEDELEYILPSQILLVYLKCFLIQIVHLSV